MRSLILTSATIALLFTGSTAVLAQDAGAKTGPMPTGTEGAKDEPGMAKAGGGVMSGPKHAKMSRKSMHKMHKKM